MGESFPCMPTPSFYGAFCTQIPGEQQRAGLIVRAKHCKPAQPCTSTQNPTDSLHHDEDLLPVYPCQNSIGLLSWVLAVDGVDDEPVKSIRAQDWLSEMPAS